ncbi:MAG: T9SS type A sorting domain-containing protein [Bacteroidetes bacterium]|nr:T9SS type A sorting domain-containing protein [Bacteroidota bacterium]
MPHKLYSLFLFLFLAQFVQGQNIDLKRTSHWYFGAKAGLDFSGGSPVPDTLGQLGTLEKTAAISDTSGNLIAYFGFGNFTADWCLFNRNHQPMLNGCGIGLPGVSTPRDCAVFIPKPGDDSIYYLFTVDGWENQFQRGLRWHEIDMRLDNGLGGVVSHDNILRAPVSEQLAATRHSNGCDYWVVTHERSSANFLAYKVSDQGVDTVPLVSAVGQDYAIAQQSYNLNGGYHLSFSPNGRKALVQVIWNYIITHIPEQIQLMSFDNTTGMFSEAINLPYDTSGSHGFFSNDNSKVYFESCYYRPCRFYQFDLSSGIDSVIQQSRTVVYTTPVAIESDGQIGLDGKIYLCSEWDSIASSPNPHFLSVIENPNALGIACNIQYATQPLGSGRAMQGLPNFVSNFLSNIPVIPCLYNFIYDGRVYEELRVLAYPNPADAQITISGNGLPITQAILRLFDVTGILWLEKQTSIPEKEIVLDVSQIPIGIYLLQIQTVNQRKAFKLFINH